jgi:diguanylate cyclase (GGDEF)-like protein
MTARQPIRRKFFLSHLIIGLLVSSCVAAGLYLVAVDSLLGQLRTRLRNTATLLGQSLDPAPLRQIQSPADRQTAIYQQTLQQLQVAKLANPDIDHVYILRRSDNNTVVFVVSLNRSQQVEPGQQYPRQTSALLQGFFGPSVESTSTPNRSGSFLSGYAPLDGGRGTYLVEVGIRDTEVQRMLASIRLAGWLSLGFAATLALVLSYKSSLRLAAPITSLIERCRAIAERRLGQSLDIYGEDEFDYLTRIVNRLSAQLVHYREQNHQTERALRTAHEEREQQIMERTRDLATINTKLVSELMRSRQTETQLFQEARTDSLTNLLNRRAMQDFLDYQVRYYQRHRTPFVILLVDIDYFKQVNDRFGHIVGDQVLQAIAQQLQQAVRTQDLVSRWGGEEFLMLLPDTDIPGGMVVAEKIRNRVTSQVYPDNARYYQITLSIGMSAFRSESTLTACIEAADRALYQAKQQGRNRIVVDSA